MHITGYLVAVLIGISLGLIGGGGSILTVPVLVYLFGMDKFSAITNSLFIVGATSLAGAFAYIKQGRVDIKTAIVFGIPSVVSVYIIRIYLLPVIPDDLFRLGHFMVTKAVLFMLIFATLMILASYSMIRKNTPQESHHLKTNNYYLIILAEGLFTGSLTGLIGAGGGFLIIPVLVNLVKMPIKTAIGTSLVIISMSSLMGFVFSVSQYSIQWPFLLEITAMAILGILIGNYISTKIDGKKLKPAFGWFVLVMGIYIIVKETGILV